jgi:hypothetical protein
MNVIDTKVTIKGVRALRAALPKVVVQRGETSNVRAREELDKINGCVARIENTDPDEPVFEVYFYTRGADDAAMPLLCRCLQSVTLPIHLRLYNERITDAGLIHLKEVKNLTRLILWNANIDDAGMIHLKGLNQLEALSLHDSKVGDAGLTRVKNLPKLAELDLNNTKVTDAGLANLKGMRKLRFLYLRGTKTTAAARKELLQSMPQLTIYAE